MKLTSIILLAVCATTALYAETPKHYNRFEDVTLSYQDVANPSPFRYAAAYDFNLSEWAPVAGSTIGSLPRFLGTSLTPEIWAIAGMTAKSRTALAGFAGVLSVPISTNGKLWAGLGVVVESAQPIGALGVLGIEIKF